MLKMFVVLFVLSMTQNLCWATMFIPLPFDKQVEEASSAVEAKLASTKVFKNDSGLTMTEYTFEVFESYNFSDEDLVNQKLVLTMPGGTFNGITSMIDGAPQFRENEKSFLLLKKIDSKIYLSNFTLGKYKIQNYLGKTFYLSEVFPLDPKLGRISKEKMIDLMKSKWKISLMIPNVRSKRTIASESESIPLIKSVHALERSIAQEEAIKTEGVPASFWGAIALFVFFFVFIFFKLGTAETQYKNE